MQAAIVAKQLSSPAIQAALVLSMWVTQAAYAQQAAIKAESSPAAAATGAKSQALTDTAAKPAEHPEDAPKPGRGGGGGIKIHGHWVIDVRNPDGKLAEHREFENSLVSAGSLISGDEVLAGLLSGNLSVGEPAIAFVQGTPGADPSTYCNTAAPPTSSITCYGLTTTFSGLIGYLPNFVAGLSSSYTFSPTVKAVFSGNFSAPATLSSISAVQTLLILCVGSAAPFSVSVPAQGQWGLPQFKAGTYSGISEGVAPGSCNVMASGAIVSGFNAVPGYPVIATLTSTSLTPALSVLAGQIVTASVTISFS